MAASAIASQAVDTRDWMRPERPHELLTLAAHVLRAPVADAPTLVERLGQPLTGCAAVLCLVATVAAFGQNATVKRLNPFTGQPEAIQQGRTLWLQYGCSGHHGVISGGAMPDEEAWKIIAYVRSLYAGDKSKMNW